MDQSSYEFKLESIRRQVDQVDTDLYEILQKRFQLTNLIGELKKEHNSIEMCETRKKQIVNRLRDKALKDGMSINLLESLYNLIINQSVVDQSTIIKDK
tara:strand:+ start:362 stop:658 length:297 start_codon:yes stop_codon:yes gene_type:complete